LRELTPALSIQAYDLAIDDRALYRQHSHRSSKLREGFVDVALSGNQFAGAVDVRHGTKAIVLHLEEEIDVVKGLSQGRGVDRLDARQTHVAILERQRRCSPRQLWGLNEAQQVTTLNLGCYPYQIPLFDLRALS